MKKCFFVFLLLPIFVIAQTSSKQKTVAKTKPKTKTIVKAKPKVTEATITKPVDGFLINGNFSGFTDGAMVTLIDGNTGQPIQNTTVQKGKFSFTGKMTTPDFRVLSFSTSPSYLTLFLDNSTVILTGSADKLEKTTVSGSTSNDEFTEFMSIAAPYQQLFSENAQYDSAVFANGAMTMENFVSQHKNAFISPLALYRFYQLSDDVVKTENLFNSLAAPVKATSISAFVSQQIAMAKNSNLGTDVPDFTQKDTAGIDVSLSQFRGKYVLVDFWASWCGPCRRENPNVVAAYNNYKNKNFTILGVSLDRPGQKDAWINAIKADNLTWTHISDLNYFNNAVAVKFGIGSIPSNLLIDPQGKLVARDLRGAALERKLQRLLK